VTQYGVLGGGSGAGAGGALGGGPILDGATEVIRVSMAGAPATNQPEFFASWTNLDGTPSPLSGNTEGELNGSTPVTIIPSPSTGQRQAKHWTVFNNDTAAVLLTFEFYDGTNARTLARVSLEPNYRVTWEPSTLWRIYNSNGILVGESSSSVAAHAPTHENGGTDEIDVTGLSGLLADEQDPLDHASDHENGGGDEIDVGGLSGLLADAQTPLAHAASHLGGGADAISTFTSVETGVVPASGGGTSNFLRADGAFASPDGGVPGSHAASHENGGGDEIDVGGLSGLLADAQTPLGHAASHLGAGGDPIAAFTSIETGMVPASGGGTANFLRADGAFAAPSGGVPAAHAASHENGGADEIDLSGLSGTLADPQTPLAHASTHEDGGADEIGVGGLSGVLADAQNPVQATESLVGGAEIATQAEVDAGTDDTRMVTPLKLASTTVTPSAHASTHENGGADEISVAGLSGLLADAQSPTAHASTHENGGADEISVAGLSGLLADAQTPSAHATTHQNGGSDQLSVAGLSGVLADDQPPQSHTLVGAKHTATGLTTGHVLRATGATTFAFAALQAADLPNHASRHASAGADAVDHNTLQNYVANQHIDWTNATAAFFTTGIVRTSSIFQSEDASTPMIQLRLAGSATDFARAQISGTALRLYRERPSGAAVVELYCVPQAASTANITFHRYTSTTGVAQVVHYLGDGTTTVESLKNGTVSRMADSSGYVHLARSGLPVMIGTPNSQPANFYLFNGSVSFWLDEVLNRLYARVRDSSGSYLSGYIQLV